MVKIHDALAEIEKLRNQVFEFGWKVFLSKYKLC
jgi:hypothetical protein